MSTKVYITVPNTGEITSELVDFLIYIRNDPRYDVRIESLKKTNRRSASHNRNMTVLEFLETDCDWYLSVDSDTVPQKNPLDLIGADKDIVGFPTLIYRNQFMWNVFIKNNSQDSYLYLEPSQLETIPSDLVECHGVGTGCILIRRNVLEAVKSPFSRTWSEDGTEFTGHDLAFCEKAIRAGFKVFFASRYICDHYKTVSFLEVTQSG